MEPKIQEPLTGCDCPIKLKVAKVGCVESLIADPVGLSKWKIGVILAL